MAVKLSIHSDNPKVCRVNNKRGAVLRLRVLIKRIVSEAVSGAMSGCCANSAAAPQMGLAYRTCAA